MTITEIYESLEMMLAEVEWNYPMDYAVTIEEVKKELKRNHPMALVKDWDKDSAAMELKCPVCSRRIHGTYMKNYCPGCGQRIYEE